MKDKFYYKDGSVLDYLDNSKILHREDGPAIEWADGAKRWYINDKLHREDGPAIEWADGTKRWYINDKRHREDGPAVECADGTKHWYINDKRHREEDYWEVINEAKALPKELKLTDPRDWVRRMAS